MSAPILFPRYTALESLCQKKAVAQRLHDAAMCHWTLYRSLQPRVAPRVATSRTRVRRHVFNLRSHIALPSLKGQHIRSIGRRVQRRDRPMLELQKPALHHSDAQHSFSISCGKLQQWIAFFRNPPLSFQNSKNQESLVAAAFTTTTFGRLRTVCDGTAVLGRGRVNLLSVLDSRK